jgi:hypothetical protein
MEEQYIKWETTNIISDNQQSYVSRLFKRLNNKHKIELCEDNTDEELHKVHTISSYLNLKFNIPDIKMT